MVTHLPVFSALEVPLDLTIFLLAFRGRHALGKGAAGRVRGDERAILFGDFSRVEFFFFLAGFVLSDPHV